LELANLNITIDHAFEQGNALIFVDHREVLNRELQAENMRRVLLFKKTHGSEYATLTLLPGKHDIEIRVKSSDGQFDLTRSIARGFAPRAQQSLLIKCDKRKKKLDLVWR